jgi:hypothetical protein
MTHSRLEKILPVSLLLLYLILFFTSIGSVPFHPDEATQIYMSRDLRIAFSSPKQLNYQNEQELSSIQRYRLIDAPLPRTIIGIAFAITNTDPINSDWNWSLSWAENNENGALPSNQKLLIARLSLGLFVPLGLFLFYLILKNVSSWKTSLFVTLLLGLNSLFLVHTRRAMAEGLAFTLYMAVLYLMISKPKSALLIGILSGLALQSKQTTLPLLLIPLLYWFMDGIVHKTLYEMARKVIIFLGSLLVIHYLLNPVIWMDPPRLTILQFQTRMAFSQNQATEYLALSSPLAVSGFISRFTAWLANTFFATAAYFDIGNYAVDLSTQIAQYRSLIIHRLINSWFSGVVILILNLFGMILSLTKPVVKNITNSRTLQILWAVTIFQTLFSIFMLPITFQRYYLINVVIAFFWFGVGLNIFISTIFQVQGKLRSNKKGPAG